jgi:hypothetical protein
MTDMIDRIADCLVEDHIDLMKENRLLRESLRELLDEYHPEGCWTAEHIEYETQQGNMMAPIVKRAYEAIRARGKE